MKTYRITADIDTKEERYLKASLVTATAIIDKILFIEIKKSNSKGYHIILWTSKFYPEKDLMKIRELIGDDARRIKLDKIRKTGKQTLFYKKEKYKLK